MTGRLLRFLLVLAGIAVMAFLLGRAIDQEAQASGRVPAAAYAGGTTRPATVRQTICQVFGRECAKAIRVAICESHLNVHAVGGGGRYWGLFQQGAYSRARYGFGWTALAQARGAKRHRDAEGWGPWPVCGRR